MESGFSHTQRNWFFAWHYIINNIGWCKSQIRWIFFNILNMTFQCSLCLDDAWNSNQQSLYLLNVPRAVLQLPHCITCCPVHNSYFKKKCNVLWLWPKMTTRRNLLHNGHFKNIFYHCKLQEICLETPASCWNVMLFMFTGPKLASVKSPKYMIELDMVRPFGRFLYLF